MERYTKRLDDGQAVMEFQICKEKHINDQDMYCSALYCRNRLKDRLAEIEDILGDDYDLDRLRELVEADRDRRCFTSHVRVGQTVWFVRDPKRNPENIVETTVEKKVYKHSGAYMKLACNSMYETSCNSIGKTVFFTREAAEAALKGEQDEKH